VFKDFDFDKSKTFSGNYIRFEKLGEGMHSSVYKCFSINDALKENPLAVKVSLEDDEEKKIAHRNEYELMAKINHPGIVSSKAIFENPLAGEIHIVMELVEGEDLSKQISKGFSLSEIRSLLR